MVLSLIALMLLHALFSTNPVVIGFQVAGVLLFLWARLTFGWRSFHVAANPTAGGLVTNGPYRYIRHPIYAAMCVVGWAGILAHLSWRSAICGTVLVLAGLVRIYCEEKLVLTRYPEYAEYTRRTWRLIPYLF